MTFKGKCCTALAAVLMAGGVTATAHATAFLNQITTTTPDEIAASQYFTDYDAAGYDQYDIAAIDDFTVSSAATVTSVSAVLGLYNNPGNGYGAYNDVSSYQVNIYSTLAAAGNNLAGDVASINLAPSAVTLVPGADTADFTETLTAPINVSLAAGTYYFGITPSLSYSNDGQIGVGAVNDAAGNAYQANPGGGFGQGTTFLINDGSNVDAEYNINGAYTNVSAAPEPSTWALMILGIGGIGFAFRRAKKHHGFTFARALAA